MFEKEKKQYEEDCKTHERPWELWQYTSRDQSSSDWHSLETHPKWSGHCIYHRKQTTFVPEYYSGLNWRDAEHLVGKTVECTNNPDYEWEVGLLRRIVPIGNNFDVSMHFYTYIRTCKETFKPPTINIGGVELPKPETMEQYEIYTKGREKPFIFVGKYRRDLETKSWHYYEDKYGILFHFRKEHIVAVLGDTAKSVIENRNK